MVSFNFFTGLNLNLTSQGRSQGLYLDFSTNGYSGVIDQLILLLKGVSPP